MYPRAIFLDKDGTLIEDVPYNVDPEKIRLAEGALEALQRLHAAGFKLIVASNQAGVALGRFAEEDLRPVEARMRELLAQADIPMDGFYYCPHHPDGQVRSYAVRCFCRKPSAGLLFQAAREHQLNLAASWMVGDILNDVEAGKRAGCRTVLLDNGHETEWNLDPLRQPHYHAPSLVEAARVILEAEQAGDAAAARSQAQARTTAALRQAITRRRASAGRGNLPGATSG